MNRRLYGDGWVDELGGDQRDDESMGDAIDQSRTPNLHI